MAPTDEKGGLATWIYKNLRGEFDLFVSDEGIPFATTKGGRTIPIDSEDFRAALRSAFRAAKSYLPPKEAINTAVDNIADEAKDSERVERLYLRSAETADAIYVDLANGGDVVKVTADGWEIIANAECPVRFRRVKNLRPMPRPTTGGKLCKLRTLLNLGDGDIGERNWCLTLAWLVNAWRTEGPLPIYAMHGEQGSAKSTNSRMLCRLIDPSAAELRALPDRGRDLQVAMFNSWCLPFDNISSLSPEMSDNLCRLSTGGTAAYRTHYEDSEESHFSGRRPIILNGIGDLATRPDLLERAFLITAPTIAKRRTERVIFAEFDNEHSALLGCLFDAVSCALKYQGSVTIDSLTRMADAQVFAVAAAPKLGVDATALAKVLTENHSNAAHTALEATPLAGAVEQLLDSGRGIGTAMRKAGEPIVGSASAILGALNTIETATREQSWPRTAARLGTELRRITPAMRQNRNIDIAFIEDGHRTIRIERK